jgi:Mat/Ecp fimbriae major subunit
MQWGIHEIWTVLKDSYMLNKMKLLLAGSIAAASLVSGAAHAATETATAEAEILTPVALSAVSDLNFGLIAASAAQGTVTLPLTSDTRACSAEVICVGTDATRASFEVTAASSGQVIALDIPTAVTLTSTAGDTMAVALTASATSITFDPAALETVYIGGTLSVGASQAAGLYSGEFDVTADYS